MLIFPDPLWGGGNGAQFIPPHPSFTMHSHTFPQVKLSRPTRGAGNRIPHYFVNFFSPPVM